MANLEKFPDEVKIAAQEKRLIVFLGSGLSRAAGLPEWKEVKKQLIDKIISEEGEKTQYNNMEYYECFNELKIRNRQIYVAELKKAFEVSSKVKTSQYKGWIEIINSWKPVSIITTNVDPLLYYYSGLKNEDFRFLLDCSPQELRDNKTFFIHGYDEQSIFDSWKRDDLYGNPFFQRFLSNLFGSYFIFFIGVSFQDKDLFKYAELTEFLRTNTKEEKSYHLAFLIEDEENKGINLRKYGIKPFYYLPKDEDKYGNFIPILESWRKIDLAEKDISEAGSKPSL